MRRLATAFGLALLYSSAYFLPFLNPYALYFVPSFFDFVVFPSLVSVVVLTPVFLFCCSKVAPRPRRILALCGAIILSIIAAKSLLDGGGYPWMNILTLLSSAAPTYGLYGPRVGRIILIGVAFACALLFVYLMRHRLSKLLRFYSTLGYALLFLAVYRCISADLVFRNEDHHGAQELAVKAMTAPVPRRVVWIIFDEMDYALSVGPNAGAASHLPNFSRLVAQGISASDANSPGRDTLFSVPSLLTGSAVSGIAIAPQNKLSLRIQDGGMLRFEERTSLFARLPGGPQSASVLGFYHPYCKMLPTLQACHSTYLGNAGRWFDSLAFFSEAVFSTLRHLKWSVQYMPESLLYHFDPMYRASVNSLTRLDDTLKNPRSALDFIHLNIPHLPNVYVQRLLRQPVGTEQAAYIQNLAGADALLGRILGNLEELAKRQDILLIVSSDHWLRTRSPQPARVPFIAWKVGAAEGMDLSRPFSTVHSGSLALAFLNGTVTSQAEVLESMARSAYYQTWIPPIDYKY